MSYNPNVPSWLNFDILQNRRSDETDLVQLGNKDETDFYNLNMQTFQLGVSSWNLYPTEEDPGSLYKFTSLYMKVSRDLIETSRQTYSLLDWLGDCGGLLDACFFLGEALLSPFSFYVFKARISSLLTRTQSENYTYGSRARRRQTNRNRI